MKVPPSQTTREYFAYDLIKQCFCFLQQSLTHVSLILALMVQRVSPMDYIIGAHAQEDMKEPSVNIVRHTILAFSHF